MRSVILPRRARSLFLGLVTAGVCLSPVVADRGVDEPTIMRHALPAPEPPPSMATRGSRLPLVRVSPEGVEFRQRDEASSGQSGWALRLDLVGFGRRGAMASVGTAEPVVTGTRVELQRGELIEWYRKDQGLVEQGFDLLRRPEGEADEPVVLHFRLQGDLLADMSEDSDAVIFRTVNGKLALRYDGLQVVDSAGSPVDARLALAPGSLEIRIHDQGAAYPLFVDPMATIPDWSQEGNEAYAYFGLTASSADVNGDGYSDVIVGAPGCDGAGTNRGCVHVYMGSPAGLATTPAWTKEGAQDNLTFGSEVAGAGDVDNDGYDDVLVSATGYSNGHTGEGIVYLYLGSSSGLSMASSWEVEGDQLDAFLGSTVEAAGDVNNDGYGDVIIGSPLIDNDQTDEGMLFVYHGSASGLESTPAWSGEGNGPGYIYGGAASSAGDVNGDGYDDIIAGASAMVISGKLGAAFVYHGSASGLSTTPNWTGLPPAAQFMSHGSMVSGIGDVNGDGYDEVIVGANFYSTAIMHAGYVKAYYGSASGVAAEFFHVQGTEDHAHFGVGGDAVGDINGDGHDDLLFSASEGMGAGAGGAYIHLGHSNGLLSGALWENHGVDTWRYGNQCDAAGDVDGDGYMDWLVTLPEASNPETYEGQIHMYLGCGDGDFDTICNEVDNCPAFPNTTQVDTDLDGHGEFCDCRPTVNSVWSVPGMVNNLSLAHPLGAGLATLSWTAADPGATYTPDYDVIVSANPKNFSAAAGATCLESDEQDTTAADAGLLELGQIRYYIILAENECGPVVGAGTGGRDRQARDCP